MEAWPCFDYAARCQGGRRRMQLLARAFRMLIMNYGKSLDVISAGG